MSRQKIPLIILAGSDSKPAALPEKGADLHPIPGPKGLALEIAGRPIIDHLIQRMDESGYFAPIFIAGPADLYGPTRGAATVIDTDGTFGDNIKAAVERLVVDCPGQSVAITTCDILPRVDELERLMSDYHGHLPLDFWYPVILTPEEEGQLGASAWKPRYRMAPEEGAKPRSFLPGHLIVADPVAIRRPLVYRSFDLAYASRNRGVLYRTVLIVSHVFGGLLWQDVKNLLSLKLPTMTWTVVRNGIGVGLGLRNGSLTSDAVALRLRRVFIRYRHRRRFPERSGRFPMMEGLSLAKDIDTEEEAREAARRLV